MKEKLSHGMYVLTTNNGGCIVDAVSQVSGTQEPLISISVMKKNNTNILMHDNNKCVLSILGDTSNMELIKIYGFNSMKNYNKFANSDTLEDENIKIPKDTLGYLVLEKQDIIENETHTVFICKLIKEVKLNEGKEITYNYYKEHKEELLKVKTENNKTAWVCLMCGYVYYGEKLPDNFTCPICGVTSDNFKKKD